MMRKIFLTVGLAWCLLSLGQARKETTVEECEKNIGESLKSSVCELRQYKTVNSPDMDKHMQCILEVVGFVDENGEVKKNVLMGLLHTVDSNVNHGPNVKQCIDEAAKVGSDQKANTFYTCFLDTTSNPGFKNAVDYNELIKAGKLQKGDPFNAEDVTKLIREIDDGMCK